MVKLSDYLVNEIYNFTKTDKFFGYIGGMIAHIVDSIYRNSSVEMINMITEQGAGFAAEGYARTNNKIGVALATSGPGATNLVTPIANCYYDSSPVLFITGQVNTYEYQKYNIKQCGFQETNIVDIVKPITKYAKIIKSTEDIKYEIHKAIDIALTDRKGPVLLDIPMDVQRAEINCNTLKEYKKDIKQSEKISFDFKLLKKSKRPLLLVGNGSILSDAVNEIHKFINKTQMPVIETIHGLSAINYDYKYNMGLIGTYGDRYSNLALYNSDLLLVLGSRLDIRQTGGKVDFMNNKVIIHVDIDDKELECNKFNKIKIRADIKDFVKYINDINIELNISKWQKECELLKKLFCHKNKEYSKPNIILEQIFNILKENTKIVFDVGNNQIWAAQSVKIKNGQRTLTSGGLGSMGFALPAAIGASFSNNKIVVITGDGGLQMNIQELEILKRRNLPVKIIVMNNKSLGMVKNFQKLYFEERYTSTVYDYSVPDFVDIAKAYGIQAASIDSDNFNINEIKNLLNNDKPTLINIDFEISAQTEPRLFFGNSIANQNPEVSKEIIEKVFN